jgi:(S)-2-hydroxyglutarate dehydrogenase
VPSEKTNVLIVGAGIVGLTIARELLSRGVGEITILEKEPELGRHASGRNSGVLHAGIYYAPDSRKARSCLAGNKLLRAYCEARGLPVLAAGKVIVARTEAEVATLEELHRRATANGARVRFVDEKELAELEPMARTVGKALYSLDTAVVDPKQVLKALRADLEGSGAVRLLTATRFLGLEGPGTARTSAGSIRFERIVNAAGAFCDVVARAFDVGAGYRLIPFKGIYRKLRPGASYPVNGNIYPVPDIRNPFLGVHFTRSVAGDVYLGPTAIPALGRENYGLLRGADGEAPRIIGSDALLFFRNEKFRSVALSEPRKYIPAYFHRDAARLVKSYDPALFGAADKVGIRPQLVDWRTKELVMDFVVEAKDASVHVLNPISPAFTASMELARSLVAEHFGVGARERVGPR